MEVLFEERAQIEGKAVMTGHTKEYMKIALEAEKNISNCIVKVRIENHHKLYVEFEWEYIRIVGSDFGVSENEK